MKANKNSRSLGEPDAHVMMRRARMMIRFLLIIALFATILLILFYSPAAYLAAFPIPVLFLAFIYVSYLEKQSRADILRVTGQQSLSQDEVEMDVQSAGLFTALVLVVLVALSALIIASTLVVDWAMVGLVAAVIFLLSVVIMLPYIPLFIINSSQDEREKLQSQSDSSP
jgi:hypothetical protein